MAADENPVRLVVPAQARFLRLARLTAAGIAGDLGFGLEAIEDLRVAIDEVCAILIERASDDSQLDLTYKVSEDGLLIEGSCRNPGAVPDLHPVAAELLAMTADDYAVHAIDGVASFRLLKRRTVAPV